MISIAKTSPLSGKRMPGFMSAVESMVCPTRISVCCWNDMVNAKEKLSEAVDYGTLKAFNPHLLPETKKADDPAALKKLMETVKDLEQRGLLQYDRREQRYDLHPVVRGVAAGGMNAEEKESYGLRVVDYFSSRPHSPYEQAKTMEDVANGLHVVRTLLKLGHYQQVVDVYRGDLSGALFFNLEVYVEILSLLRPFFPAGWEELSKDVDISDASYFANDAAIALYYCGEFQKALDVFGAALQADLKAEDWVEVGIRLKNISSNLVDQNLLAKALRVSALTLDLAIVREDNEAIFISQFLLFSEQSCFGQWQAAEATWRQLDPMERDWDRAVYRQGNAEYRFALFQFRQGNLQEKHITAAEILAKQDGNRAILRYLHRLRGIWRLEQGEWVLAAASFNQAVSMARERRLVDVESETGLALAKFYLGQLVGDDARSEAERLAQLVTGDRYLALLWLAIGDHEQAKQHALAAYRGAWADGEPYVNRYALTKATELLQQTNVPIPDLPPYDPAKDEPFSWEADVRAAIEKLRAEKAAKNEKRD